MDPNQKKLHKDQRRKHYDDLQVQGTNNSSIVSKRSVERLYGPLQPELGQWFQHFVKNGKRRSPAINRGYWIRMEAIRQMVLKCAKANRKVQVVNLGCGFDPLPFQLMESYPEMRFLDFDYPELVQNKKNMIKESKEIMELLGEVEIIESKELLGVEKKDSQAKKTRKKKDMGPVFPSGPVLSSSNYLLVGCDLKDQKLYSKLLGDLLHSDYTTVFIAEVSLAYMKPEFADPIIRISSGVKMSHFVILEQVLPDGTANAFAQKMLYHFAHLRSPLQCVETYPTREDQVSRFKQWYPHVEIANLFENWRDLVDQTLKEGVAGIEDFDEWEEFIVFCQHYVIVHASTESQLWYPNRKASCVQDFAATRYQAAPMHVSRYQANVELKFAAAAAYQGQVILHGGLHQAREGKTVSLDRVLAENGPCARMCHTLTTLGSKCILVGGRTRPGHNLDDVWEFSGEWRQIGALPMGVSRHAACAVDGKVLVFAQGRFFNVGNETTELSVDGEIPPLASCAMCYNGSCGIIVGGIVDDTVPVVSQSVYKFTVVKSVVTIQKLFNVPLLGRIGAESAFVSDDEVMVVGGVCPEQLLSRKTNIVIVSIDGTIKTVDIPEDVYKDMMLIGSRLVPFDDGWVVVGGGAVCYSFGTFYSGVFKIKHST